MNVEYKRDLQNNYLILEAPQEVDAEDYHLKMAEQNPIPGLLSFHSARKDGVLYLHYEITSKQPLESIFEKRLMGYEDIFSLLVGIREALEAMQKFLLDPAQLVFDPQYLFVDADRRRVQLCYLPGNDGRFPISLLAEFILKRLDHREQKAVDLGYNFYQKTTEENFSLQRTLRESLAAEEDNGNETEGQGQSAYADKASFYRREAVAEKRAAAENRPAYDGKHTESEAVRRTDSSGGDFYPLREELFEETDGISPELREAYQVTRRERSRKKAGKVDKLFQVIHPAVLISTLLLLVLLEVVFSLGMLTITEAGGIFFFLISAEALANKFWRASREKKKANQWADEDDDEMYRQLQEEMYEAPEEEPAVGETQCLTSVPEQSGLRLVCICAGAAGPVGQDIFVGAEPVYVGKIKGESDVILDSPTVSRRHARLECRDGVCYVRDLNSRNGTFCNGRRLRPQEQCQFAQGDEISFAEIGYRVVLSAASSQAQERALPRTRNQYV